MSIALRHPVSRRVMILPEGWSWGCFFGVGLLGLPLFRRGLARWGAVMVALNTVALVLGFAPVTGGAGALAGWLGSATLALNAYLGFKANDMAISRYLVMGWEFDGPAPARWRTEALPSSVSASERG